MFIGSIPKETVEQAVRVIRIDTWREVYVCCSGSFRIERALAERFPHLTIRSNDVSLLTCSVGCLAAKRPLRIEFVERLAFVEEHLDDAIDGHHGRAAAVLVALAMGKFTGGNAYAQRHFAHYVAHFRAYLDAARVRLATYLDGLRVDTFHPGDFRKHARAAMAAGPDVGVVAWPPTYKGGYERMYKFLRENTRWDEPSYDVFDPSSLAEWVRELRDSGVPFWVGSDHALEGLDPAFAFFFGRNRPVYSYATAAQTSLRSRGYKATPFRYCPIDASSLTRESVVSLVPAKAEHMNFIKDKYLAAGLVHATGQANFLVFVDGRLAGGFIYARAKSGAIDELYLLSDFSLSRERKVAKLIAMLASSERPVRAFDRSHVQRTSRIVTTVFTTKPVSMKYRGIFELHARKPGFLQYTSAVRSGSEQDVYRDWYDRYAGPPSAASSA